MVIWKYKNKYPSTALPFNAPNKRPQIFIHSSPSTMNSKSKHPNNKNTSNFSSFWKWNINDSNKKKKKNGRNQFPVPEFLQDNYKKVEETILGPGGAVGIGCGIGAGFGLVGGAGYGGWPWNHIKLVLGVGVGCGVGFGFGYGNGLGHGFRLDPLESYFSKRSDTNKKRVVIEI